MAFDALKIQCARRVIPLGKEGQRCSAIAFSVVTVRWSPTEAEVADTTTAIHRFSITDPTVATYETSGKVPGYALNQFSLSEHAGYLRIATTTEPPWNTPCCGADENPAGPRSTT